MSNTVLVLGASGLLGATLCPKLRLAGWRVLRQSRHEGYEIRCNPSDYRSTIAALKGLRLTAIVNLVAASDVDYCECNLSEAYVANVKTVEVCSKIVHEMDPSPHFLQISTDQLYGGVGPHDENSAAPLNVYALTKLTAEQIALQANATVLRTNFFGRSLSPNRISFTDWLYRALISEKQFVVFEDIQFSGLHIESLVNHIISVLEAPRAGIFNVGSRAGLSKADFAKIFAEALRLDTSSMKVDSSESIYLKAPRPKDMRMDTAMFESKFGLKMPDLSKEIIVAANEYRSKLQ